MKPIVITLVALLLLLQYELWFAPRGVIMAYRLHRALVEQSAVNAGLKERNAVLVADIHDLKSGNEAIEERARHDLGMIKSGEVFYQIVHSSDPILP